MSEPAEQLYGGPGVEQSQGYQPMPPSAPEPSAPSDLTIDEAVVERTAPAVPDNIVERAYVSLDGSNAPRPANETVELERSVGDLAQRRAEEFKVLDELKQQALADELKRLRSPVAAEIEKAMGGQPTMTAEEIANLPIEQQIRMLQAAQAQQAEQPQPQPEQPAAADQDLTKILQDNPRLMEAINQQRQADWAGAHQAVQAAEKWIQDSAAQATAGVFAAFPELQNLGINELPIALNMMQKQNPQRFQQAMQHINAIQGMLEQSRYVQAQQQQRAQQQYQHEWSRFSQNEDNKFIQRNPQMADPQQASVITNKAVNYLKSIGFSDDDLSRTWNGNATLSMRDHRTQQLVLDALSYREAKAGVPQARRNTPPRVAVPGPAGTIARQEDIDMRALSNQLNGATGNAAARLGAQMIAERRARNRGR